MRGTKRGLGFLLALLLICSFFATASAAAGNAVVTDVTLEMPEMKAGAMIGSHSITVPDGAQYAVEVTALRLLPFTGAQDALKGYSLPAALENGHVYELQFKITPSTGAELSDNLTLTVLDSGVPYRNLSQSFYTDGSGTRCIAGRLTYEAGYVPSPATVSAIALTSSSALIPEPGQTLPSTFGVTTTPAGGSYKSETEVRWITAAPDGAPVPASGAVQRGQAYYAVTFSILPAERHMFAFNTKLTLNGEALPDGMLRLLSRTNSHIAAFGYAFYGIRIGDDIENGTAAAPQYAGGGELVQLTATPDEGYEFAAWTATDQLGNPITIGADGKFLMPDPIPASDDTPTLQPVVVTPTFRPEHKHDLRAFARVEPGCTTAGTEAYWKCSLCGRMFSDGEGQNEIESVPVLLALGHSTEIRNAKEPTAAADGYTGDEVCVRCSKVIRAGSVIPKLTPDNPFSDVKEGQYFYEPVLWAVNHDPQITNGLGNGLFGPETVCTRGQVVTFLWRAAGCPVPSSTSTQFADVHPGDYFYSAVLWAVENNITNGVSRTQFAPNSPCTRAHVVTFLWRAKGQPPADGVSPFRDVPAGQYYTEPVLWAVAKDITNGTGPNTFSPGDPCTRGQIVTFLFRAK